MSKHKKENIVAEDQNKPELQTDNQENTLQSETSGQQEQPASENLINQLEALQSSYNEVNDRYLRLFSEFDNYRKRTLKEKIELSKTASADIIKALLPIVDDFERAIGNFPENESNSHLEGIRLIYNNLKRMLEQQGLEEIKAQGETFDTDFHEAVTHVPAPEDHLKGKVLEVIKKGYSLQGKIIRFAQVIVGS